MHGIRSRFLCAMREHSRGVVCCLAVSFCRFWCRVVSCYAFTVPEYAKTGLQAIILRFKRVLCLGLYLYHDDIKIDSRRVCFRSRVFYRLAWCPALPRMLSGSFAACGVGSLQAGNVMWCGACRVVLSACAACGMLSACGVSCHPVKACGMC